MSAGPKSVHSLARLLDTAFRVPGTRFRFGLDPILGLIPGGGDIAGGALSAWIIIVAARLGAPAPVLIRMAGNVLVDTLLGTVPLLGDLFDASWKANTRNAALLERYEATPEPVTRRSRMVLALVIAVLIFAVVATAAVSVVIVRWVIGLF